MNTGGHGLRLRQSCFGTNEELSARVVKDVALGQRRQRGIDGCVDAAGEMASPHGNSHGGAPAGSEQNLLN